jgi:hypothetical protein
VNIRLKKLGPNDWTASCTIGGKEVTGRGHGPLSAIHELVDELRKHGVELSIDDSPASSPSSR